MRFGVMVGYIGYDDPLFLTKAGLLSNNIKEMETFVSIKEAAEAVSNIMEDKIVKVVIEFSGFIREQWGNNDPQIAKSPNLAR